MKLYSFAKKALFVCLFAIIICCVLCIGASAEGECTQHASEVWHQDPQALPNCTEGGFKFQICDVCGEQFNRTEVSALGHVVPEEYEIDEATCQKPGEKYKKCEECGEKVESITLEITDHVKSDWLKNTKKPVTCTTNGEEYIECIYCKTVMETREITSSGHKMVVLKKVDSTCTKNGHTEGKICAACGLVETQYEIIPAGHKGEEIIPAVPATKDAEGKTEGKMCPVCGEILVPQQVVPKVSYLWLNILIVAVASLLIVGLVVFVIVLPVKRSKKIAAAAAEIIDSAAETTEEATQEAAEVIATEDVAEEAPVEESVEAENE